MLYHLSLPFLKENIKEEKDIFKLCDKTELEFFKLYGKLIPVVENKETPIKRNFRTFNYYILDAQGSYIDVISDKEKSFKEGYYEIFCKMSLPEYSRNGKSILFVYMFNALDASATNFNKQCEKDQAFIKSKPITTIKKRKVEIEDVVRVKKSKK